MTSPTAADAGKCALSLTTPPAVDAGGGTGSFSVTAQPECAWTASTSVDWISGLSPTSGQGNGSVSFRVSANDGASVRDTDIVVNNSRVHVSQKAQCRYDVTPQSQNVSVVGGEGVVTVAAASDCAWTASSDVPWISLTPPLTGSGNGTVKFTAAPNSGSERNGSVSIGGQRSTVIQNGVTACNTSISPATQNVAATGGGGTVAVAAQPQCSWTASSNVPWITVTSGAGGSGNGSVSFTVAANPGAARTGTLTIAGNTMTVMQAGTTSPSCTFSISPTTQNVAAAGGTGSVTVSTTSTCAWTAASSAPFVTITSGASGTGNGSVAFSVAANTGGARNGTMTIAGQPFTVSQAAAPAACTYSISPTNQNVASSAGTGTVTVSTSSACAWTATSTAMWITITSGSTGTGNGSVAFSFAANTGAARSGTITIASQTFTLMQAAPCTYSISPTALNAPDTASSGTVSVSAGSTCAWTATSHQSFITITSGATGTGDGTVAYTIAANTGGPRNGTMTIAGQTFSVSQAAPCTYSISPNSQNIDRTGGVGTVRVTTQAGCSWTATSNSAFVTITSGQSGTGNGTVNFVVPTNTGAARTGTLTVAGRTATVQQQSGATK
ncbi:MAG TPA: BACON domain-containing carbohydrate-binding protein [Vicinamibacterales bacterium]|nr:BACON domain-containing carbohydrate-binding protein [Vicinamibacterales bacterium]